MAFQTPITVREAVENVSKGKYLLPSIQRELVWDTFQIERLFDSLMRDYPVGSFLFWYVERQRSRDFQFYEFIRNFHERKNSHNAKANVNGEDDITAILDGQQRLTALYIGLKGSYAYKEPRKRWDNDLSFPKRMLYLNLLKPCEDNTDLLYDFQFLTDSEAKETKNGQYHWFKVSDILSVTEEYKVNDYLIQNGLFKVDAHMATFANKTLFRLFSLVHKDRVINYFLERDESLDKVLNIFIRVNSGGTPLNYSDLLLSIATAQWTHKDAREEITEFVEEINNVGDGFDFDKDFVLKTCLVLSDIADIAFKVDNFNRDNMTKIESKWDEISQAIRLTVTFLSSIGYSRDTLTSKNAVIPIAYFILRKQNPQNFDVAQVYRGDRESIQKWLVVSLLKRSFGAHSDTVLRPLRNILAQKNQHFPLADVVQHFKGTPKSLSFNSDEIRNLFEYRYSESYTFSTLAILYPTLDFRNRFHLDHIHPRSFFTKPQLKKRSIPTASHEFFVDNFDYLANLQLLEGVPNQEKSNKPFKDWLVQTYPSQQARQDFMKRNYIPDIDLDFSNFEQFIEERTKLMTAEYQRLLTL